LKERVNEYLPSLNPSLTPRRPRTATDYPSRNDPMCRVTIPAAVAAAALFVVTPTLLAATAAHAETIYLKCWARGLTGDQRNSVYINGEQVTVNLDEGTMHSWTFGSNLVVHVTDTHLFFETRAYARQHLANSVRPNLVWQGFINEVDGTLKAHKRDGTVISGHCRRGPAGG
jgi:hypothetical protein